MAHHDQQTPDRQLDEGRGRSSVIRVAIADDHPLYRDGLRTMVDSLPGLEFVGAAADGSGAAELVARLQPDVLLLDLEMPGGGGMATLRAIRDAGMPTAVVVVTMHEDDPSLVAAMAAGARGYVSKGAGRTELAHAIATCAAGGVVFSGQLSGRVARLLAHPTDRAARTFPTLTPREREVLDRLARGEDNASIARVLGLSSKTVRNVVSVVLGKLAVPDRAAAMLAARDAGMGGQEPPRD
jgi:DNA-binding NarL/FixJ family response regulator